jgi:formate/nitrite transporter FocA (FNT family)
MHDSVIEIDIDKAEDGRLHFKRLLRNVAHALSGNTLGSLVNMGWLSLYVTPHVSKPHDYVNHMFMRL